MPASPHAAPASLDTIDEQLLALLTRNARESTTNLAKKVGLSRPAVHERIRRLERDGVIRGYTTLCAPGTVTSGLRAQVLIYLDPRQQERVLETLSGYPEVRRLMTVSGEYDLVAELAARDPAELDRLLVKIGKVPGVSKTITLLMLATRVDRDHIVSYG
jgi:DNA-binding Lrp family transcriptional regulator